MTQGINNYYATSYAVNNNSTVIYACGRGLQGHLKSETVRKSAPHQICGKEMSHCSDVLRCH